MAAQIAEDHHLTLEELVGHGRQAHLVKARVDFWSSLRSLGWSYPAIAALVGRDPSSVMKTLGAHGRRVPAETL